MKFKVGMYVRIKNKIGYCIIGKIENINDYRDPMMKYCIDVQSSDYIFVPEDMIIKASHNIIDLLEVGDVITTNNLCGQVTYIEGDKIYTTCYDGECCYDYQIQSIVTKESFESTQYKVGE